MRILHVISSMDPAWGGVCQAVRTIVKGLKKESEVESEVVSLDPANAEYLKRDSFVTHSLGPANNPWSYSPKLLPWLRENLSRFDAVIVHGLWLYHGYAVWKAVGGGRWAVGGGERTEARGQRALDSEERTENRGRPTANRQPPTANRPRLFLMPHGMLDPYFQRDPSRKLKALRNVIYWKLIERKMVNEADGLLFTCEDEKLLAREPFRPYQPKKEAVVGLGVEEPPASTAAMKAAFAETCRGLGDQPYLLFLSRIHPKKGVDLLIKAYSKLAREHFESSSFSTAHCSLLTDHFPSLVIAGPLDSTYAKEMQALAADLLPSSLKTENFKLQTPRIHFVGMLTGDAKWGAFHGCEAFVLPSHQENFGIAVVEALACGKPVLISNKVNIWREIVEAGAGIAEDDTLEGTVQLLSRMLNFSKFGNGGFKKNALACFKQTFCIETTVTKLLECINEWNPKIGHSIQRK